MQGQHRAVSPGDVTKTPHFHCCSGLALFLAFAVHLAALAGPEADLAVWVFLRATPTRQSVLDSQVFFWVFFGVFRECFFCFSRVSAIFFLVCFSLYAKQSREFPLCPCATPAPPLRNPCATPAPPLRLTLRLTLRHPGVFGADPPLKSAAPSLKKARLKDGGFFLHRGCETTTPAACLARNQDRPPPKEHVRPVATRRVLGALALATGSKRFSNFPCYLGAGLAALHDDETEARTWHHAHRAPRPPPSRAAACQLHDSADADRETSHTSFACSHIAAHLKPCALDMLLYSSLMPSRINALNCARPMSRLTTARMNSRSVSTLDCACWASIFVSAAAMRSRPPLEFNATRNSRSSLPPN